MKVKKYFGNEPAWDKVPGLQSGARRTRLLRRDNAVKPHFMGRCFVEPAWDKVPGLQSGAGSPALAGGARGNRLMRRDNAVKPHFMGRCFVEPTWDKIPGLQSGAGSPALAGGARGNRLMRRDNAVKPHFMGRCFVDRRLYRRSGHARITTNPALKRPLRTLAPPPHIILSHRPPHLSFRATVGSEGISLSRPSRDFSLRQVQGRLTAFLKMTNLAKQGQRERRISSWVDKSGADSDNSPNVHTRSHSSSAT